MQGKLFKLILNKYFQLCMQIHLSYMPSEIQLTEDIVSCLSPSMVHVFKVTDCSLFLLNFIF